MNTSSIIEKAEKLGVTGVGNNDSERVQSIAEQFGVSVDKLEEALDLELSTMHENNYSSDSDMRRKKFGEKEYDATGGDKNYYNNRGQELAADLEEKKKKAEEAKKAKEEAQRQRKETSPVDPQARRNASKNYRKAKKEYKQAEKDLKDAKRARIDNNINKFKSNIYKTTHPLEAAKKRIKNKAKGAVKKATKSAGKAIGKVAKKGAQKLISLIISNPYIALIIAIIIILFFLVLTILMFFSDGDSSSSHKGLYGYEYVEPNCTQITIIPDDNENDEDYVGVYDLEEYVAGVVEAEFNRFDKNEWNEAIKALAILARSYGLVKANNNSCTIENNSKYQNYKPPSEKAIAIANETRGLVLVENDKIQLTEYDAFCTDSPQDDPYNYIVCQQNQKVPRSWVDAQSGIYDHWKNGTRSGAHGRGMSQWGAAYLAEQGYDYEDILEYYYGDFEIRSVYKSLTYTGDYSIEPDNEMYANLSFFIKQPLSEYLANNSSSVEEMNDYLYRNIKKAGIGTREGVVAAAVSLIGMFAEQNLKLNYQWGGKYEHIGLNPNWGAEVDMNWLCGPESYGELYDSSNCFKNYKWSSFDCSGFVAWAYINGMQNEEITQSQTSWGESIPLDSNKGVCIPGSALRISGHIVLVVDVDEENKYYIVAESTGSNIETGSGGVKLSKWSFEYAIKNGYNCMLHEELYEKYGVQKENGED